MTGASLPESMIFAIAASCAPFGCTPMIAARTPSFLAFSSDGGWTNETRTPPFFKTDQERSCVSSPSVSRTMSIFNFDGGWNRVFNPIPQRENVWG